MSSTTLATTPLHDWHSAHGGRMVDFAGWSMPVQYHSIIKEHLATRSAATLFDVSHMGRFRFDGPSSGEFLDSLLTRRVADMSDGQIRYSLVTNDDGGILDDVLVYRMAQTDGTPYHWLVVNASNREKIAAWIREHLDESSGVKFSDLTTATAMIAVQGPLAIALVEPQFEIDLARLKYFTGVETHIAGHDGIVSRTGYTGEDGCELILPAAAATHVWQTILAAGASQGVIAAGLGARDTLRLEAAMPLYGHELSEEISPYQAGLAFAVNLKNREKNDRTFPGRDSLVSLKNDTAQLRRVGLDLTGKRAARQGYPITSADQTVGPVQVGTVTSGSFSPTLDRPIAIGYVHPQSSEVGTKLNIDIRGRSTPATVVSLPFYRRQS